MWIKQNEAYGLINTDHVSEIWVEQNKVLYRRASDNSVHILQKFHDVPQALNYYYRIVGMCIPDYDKEKSHKKRRFHR